MCKNVVLFYLLTILLHYSICEKLIFASLHSRHGPKAPVTCDENSIDYLGESWANPGELTPVGQRMEYVLGLRNRQRYIVEKHQLLSPRFDPHEIQVFSTDSNTTILGVYCQLQGLYPMYNQSGFTLTEGQLRFAVPNVDVSDEDIQEEIKNLNDSALPNYMSVLPVHVYNPHQLKLNLHENSTECSKKLNKTRDKNKKNKDTIIKAANDFNSKYAKSLNKYYDKNPENFKYDFDWIGMFCENLIADLSDGRKMDNFFKKTGIQNKDELHEDCKKIVYINLRDDFYGDDKNEVILFEGSNFMKEIITFMKIKVKEDMSDEKKINIKDYSKPKLMIYSGDDGTLSGEILFMIKFFNLSLDEYIYPTYATQLTFEVTRADERPKNASYADYKVSFYINDKLILEKNYKEFKEVVENNVWGSKQIKQFCVIDDDDDDGGDDGGKDGGDKSNKIQLWILITLGVFTLILIIAIVILVIRYTQINKKVERISTPEDNNTSKETDKKFISDGDAEAE